MTTTDIQTTVTSSAYADRSLTRLQKLRWASGPLALTVGPIVTVLGFALHPGAMEDREFVAWTSHHAAQFAIAHLLIGFGAAITAVGVWSVLRLVRGKRGAVLLGGAALTFVGMVGMGYDHLAHGAVGYALASSPQVPLGMSTDAQVTFETLPYVGWSGLFMMFFPLGVILLGIGALVSRRIPTWAAILLILGPVGTMFAGVGAAEILGSAPLMIGFAALARAAWKTRPLV
jgi:MFS family permease